MPLGLNNLIDLVDSIITINPVFPDYTRILMKKIMKTKWKMLTLAAMLSATTTATAGDHGQGGVYDEDAYFSDGTDYAASLYDDSNRPAAVSEESFDEESVEEHFEENFEENFGENYYGDTLEPVAYVGDDPSYHSPSVGSGTTMQPASHSMNHSSMSCGGCGDSACGGSCGDSYSGSCGTSSSCGTPRRSRRSVLSGANAWLTAEALLWFPEVRSSVPLISSNELGVAPELDIAGTSVLFGGQDAFGGELQAGFRLDGGFMLSEDFGVGGRFWMLPETEDSFSDPATLGTRSLGVPYFDSDLVANQENSVLIDFDDTPGADLNADFQGSVDVRNSFEMYGAEAYGRLRLLEGKGYRSDFIGGFSHFGIDEDLTLNLETVQTQGVGAGETFTFNDRIDAENRFYGGQLGFLTTVGRGAWRLTALTKVHLGDMEQTFRRAGGRSRNNFDNQTAGIFGASFDDAVTTQNNFTFAPEANLKLTFKMRPHVRFSVGYSFIMWDDVLLLGDNLNRNFATTGLLTDGTVGGALGPIDRPAFQGLETDSFFVHGLDLGAVIEF